MQEKGIGPYKGLLFIIIFLFISPADGFPAQIISRMKSGIGATVIVPSRGCTIMTTKLLFNSDTFGAGARSDGNVSVSCDRGVTYGISLDGGINPTAQSRRMKSAGSGYLNYSLYQDRGRSLLWGNGSRFGPTKSSAGNGRVQVHKIYGSAGLSGGQGAGTYTDQISVTIYY